MLNLKLITQPLNSYQPMAGNDGDDIPNKVERKTLSPFSQAKLPFVLSQKFLHILPSLAIAFVLLCSSAAMNASIIDSTPHQSQAQALGQYIDPLKGFDSIPNSDSLRSHLKYITQSVHIAGKGKSLAEWYAKKLQSYGLKTEIVKYYPYLNYPSKRRLAIVSPPALKYEAKLVEDVIDEDPTSLDPNAVPTFHGLSANGNVTAELVYANYGTWEDFKVLKSNNVTVKGKIALVRYGKCFRGLKLRAAELNGAVGVLIYSDPLDDGENLGDVYPKGPYRPSSGVQRGTVSYLSLSPGDPLTPGVAATKDAKRISLEKSKILPKIPSLPISYGDALPLLKALVNEGKQVDKLGSDWTGGLKVSYWTGPSKAKVNLINIVDGGIQTIYNVIATIPGEKERNKQIIVGNHRDGWVYGANDPGSGSSMMLEVARTLGSLLKGGWRPKRTIKLCSWDAEEYGLIGSTEWVEDFSKKLSKEAIVYINVDAFEGTQFSPSGTPSLLKLVKNITAQVKDPHGNGTIYDSWYKDTKGKTELQGLGSGSDYTPFYQHLGISSLDLKFYSKIGSGVYHSNYDSFHFVDKFGDPGFKIYLAMTQIVGKLLITLADKPLVSFHLAHYGSKLTEYIDKVDQSLKEEAKNKLNLLAFRKAVSEFTTECKKIDDKAALLNNKLSTDKKEGCQKDNNICINELNWVNNKMIYLERKMLDQKGIEGREFYKHFVYAPGLWAGYGSQVFPSLNEALEANDFKKTNEVVCKYTDLINEATAFLKSESL